MSETIMIIAILIQMVCVFALGIIQGVYMERKSWNALIKQGKLPKPGGK